MFTDIPRVPRPRLCGTRRLYTFICYICVSVKQLAIRADVTTKTLANWIESYHDQLYAMGMRPYQILPPRVVEWLAHHYGIDVED